jgi:uncharacterized membrane protein YfcA
VAPWPIFVIAGAAIGALTGLFGVGGSSIATPMLAMLGVPPIMAVASPLPATIPSAAALLVVIALAIPTLIVHWSPGHIDRTVAAAFALGAVPGAFVAGRFAHVVEGPRIRRAFGWFLTVSGVAFLVYRLAVRP